MAHEMEDMVIPREQLVTHTFERGVTKQVNSYTSTPFLPPGFLEISELPFKVEVEAIANSNKDLERQRCRRPIAWDAQCEITDD